MGNHATSQYSDGVLESTGESLSLAEEEIFESSSASSVADEQKSNQFGIRERHVSKTSLNVESSNEFRASSMPLSAPNAKNYFSISEIDGNYSDKFTLVNNPNHSSLEKCSPADSDCVSFETTEKVSLFGSSFDSSSSSIVNVSHQSNACSEENEELGLSSEASLLQCIEKMQVVLSIMHSGQRNGHNISRNSFMSLKDLHQTIGVFLICSQELSTSENVLSKEEKEDVIIQSLTHAYNIVTQSGCEEKYDFNTTEGGNNSFSPDGENMFKSTSDHSHCSRIMVSKTNQNLDAVETNDFKSKDNLPESSKQAVSKVKDEPREAEAACMFIAEQLSIEPCLMKSLAALQTSTGVGSLLTDADTNSGTFNLTEPCSQGIPSTTVLKSPKGKLRSDTFSASISKSPNRTTVAPINDGSTKTKTKSMLDHRKYPIVLSDILSHNKSAAAIGKAVIKNALAFQKYAELFKVALNEDLVAAAIGRALCKNALSLEDMLRGTDVDKAHLQNNQIVNRPTCDRLSFKKKSNPVKPIPSQLQDKRNKENESPAIEHLFKQTPCKRKLALEEETRRIKCLALSPKQTPDHDVIKSGKKTNYLSFNESESSFDVLAKGKKKTMLQEIITNDRRIQNNDSNTKYFSLKDKSEKKPSRPTLKCHTEVFDQWTVVKADDKEILEFDESDEETAFYLQSNLEGNFNKVGVQEGELEDSIQINHNWMTEIFRNTSKQLDSNLWVGVYYFVNKYIFCSTCNVNIFNYLRLLDHVNSETHKANIIEHSKIDASFINVGAMLQSVWDRIELNLGKTLFCKLIHFEDDTFFCSLCNVQACGHLNVIAHVHAKSHQLNVLQKIYSSTTGHNSQQDNFTETSQSKISWPDSMSSSSSNTSLSEKEGSIVEWFLPSQPSISSVSEGDLSGIYYFAKNYVFCSVCNINMFNSSIVLGHVHAKSHQANKALQKQIESSKKQTNGLNEYNKLEEIWNQIERTLGGTLFHTVLCIDNNANFFCDLCNIQIINPSHMGVLDHVCINEHNKKFFRYIQHPSSK